MLGQLLAILHLKWMFARHNATKGPRLLGMIAMFVFGALILAIALGLFGGAIALGAAGIEDKSPSAFLFILDMATVLFIVMWLAGTVSEVQKQTFLDIGKMLYLPVSLRMVYGINLAFAFVNPFCILFMLPMMGLCLGLAIDKGPLTLLGIPIIGAYFVMLLVWRQYLIDLFLGLSKKAKARAGFVFSLLSVLPMILYFSAGGGGRWLSRTLQGSVETSDALVQINAWVPLGWHAYGVYALTHGDVFGAALALAGLVALGVLGGALGYRATLRRYRGMARKDGGDAGAAAPGDATGRTRMIDLGFPLMDRDTAAMFWMSILRNARTQQIVLIVSMFVVVVLLGVGYALYAGMEPPAHWGDFVIAAPLIGIIWPAFSMQVFSCNLFGTDHNGFRSLILLPVPRRKYLLARNLAIMPFNVGQMLLIAGAGAYLMGLGPMAVAVAAMMAVQFFLMQCMVGNVLSCVLPFRVYASGWGKNTQPYIALLSSMFFMVTFPFLLLPMAAVVVSHGFRAHLTGLENVPVALLGSAFLLCGTLLAYCLALSPTASLLASREPAILEALVKDKE